MAAPGKLTPPARLLWVLFNRRLPSLAHGEVHGPETLLARVADREPLAHYLDLIGTHHLFCDGA